MRCTAQTRALRWPKSRGYNTMIVPPFPANEVQRRRALAGYKILDTAEEPCFDELAHFTTKILETPIALISLIDADRQWFKSHVGLDATEAPRELSFCAYTLLQSSPHIVPDAWLDPRFVNNPFVTGEPYMRFYAAVPLIDSAGFALGTLSAIDRVARAITRVQLLALQKLGAQVMAHLESRSERNTSPPDRSSNPMPLLDLGSADLSRPLAGLRVLVAEDNIVSQLTIRKLLNPLGCEATLVESGIAAINAWNSRPFDLVMMDCKMPGIDGNEATRRIRAASVHATQIPIIAMADRHSSLECDIAILAGADEFLVKPILADDLLAILQRVAQSRELHASTSPAFDGVQIAARATGRET